MEIQCLVKRHVLLLYLHTLCHEINQTHLGHARAEQDDKSMFINNHGQKNLIHMPLKKDLMKNKTPWVSNKKSNIPCYNTEELQN